MARRCRASLLPLLLDHSSESHAAAATNSRDVRLRVETDFDGIAVRIADPAKAIRCAEFCVGSPKAIRLLCDGIRVNQVERLMRGGFVNLQNEVPALSAATTSA